MKRWLTLSGLVLLVAVMVFAGTVYYNYYQDEQEIARVMEFRQTALKAFQALSFDKIDIALVLYEQALQIHTEDAKTMADYAQALKKAGRFNEAADSFLKAYILDTGKDEKNLNNAGVLFMQQQRYHEAMAVYKTLLRSHKRLFRYVDQIVLSAWRLGDQEKALAYYAYITDQKPDWFDDKEEFAEISRFYHQQIERIPAIDLREVHETSSDIAELQEAAAELKREHYYKQAVFTYQKIIELEPGNDEARKKAARLFIKHGNQMSALELLEEVEVKDFETWFTLGGIHHENRRYELALEHYREALKIKKDVQLLTNMSSCAFFLNDLEAMARYFILLEDMDPLAAYKFRHAVALNQNPEEESKKERLLHHARLLWFSLIS